MKIHVLSDIHLEFYPFSLPQTDADVVVLAGDIGTHTRGLEWAIEEIAPMQKPLLYVIGNHEFYGAELHGLTAELQKRAVLAREKGIPVWVLADDEIQLNGVRFLGCTLWTNYQMYGSGRAMEAAMAIAKRAMNDHRLIRYAPHDRFTPFHALECHNKSVRWLDKMLSAPFSGKTVVITHHLPSETCVAPQYKGDPLTPAFASRLDHLVKKADLWIYGHTHEGMQTDNLVCNPRGYVRRRPWGLEAENPEFNPALVVDL